MEKLQEMIAQKEIKGISDYFTLYRRLNKMCKEREPAYDKALNVAILSSFTSNGIKESLYVKCCAVGIFPKIYVAEYKQYTQEILNPESRLYQSSPNLIILFIDTMTLWGDDFFQAYRKSDESRSAWVSENGDEIESLIEKIKTHSSAKILVHNLAVPEYSPLGILENKQGFGFFEATETLNRKLREVYKTDQQVFVFDYDAFCSKIGKQNIVDPKMYYIGDMKLSLNHMPALADAYLPYIKSMMSMTKKCLVLDLDNTLWGGVIGEDGLEGIHLGPTPEGRPFLEFQHYILSLFDRGVILAINSKNNFEDAIKVIREHPDMILREKHFAAMRINWDDKISNIQSIAEEINIGLGSLVFLDDDRLNQEMVRTACPDVLVPVLPEDPSLYLKTLMDIDDFNSLHLTDEDKNKGQMYAAQKRRKEIKKTTTDLSGYLKQLKTKITIEEANPFTMPRISQLTQKTNQFNMTTKRYLEEDIKALAIRKDVMVLSLKAEDKFGDNGITGVAIVKKGSERWEIDSFLLSCRVLGRKIEETFLAYIIEKAKNEKAKILVGSFIPTQKNVPARGFFKRLGFCTLEENNQGCEISEYDLNKDCPYPDFIQLIRKD
ncbi:Polyketide synthase modules and related proteins [hydrothermal vent metagenome]|uniref:Polyketide synthase modules and related proteins n=1 Tax=hydrothermal vent metagenome TaxID=652676 RepID=A0A3B1CSM9_9ZZZZ